MIESGLFELVVLSFDLTNSSATFQRFVERIFEDMVDPVFVFVYLDHILTFSRNMMDHANHVNQVHKRL